MRTARLELRQIDGEDAPAMFERYAQDAVVTRYLSWPPHTDLAETHTVVERMVRSWDTGEGFVWGIHEHTTKDARHDALVGTIGLEWTPHGLELGYVLARDWWGDGVMTEAATPIVDWVRSQPNHFRVWAYCHVDNPASARVLEKVGMRFEGRLHRWAAFPNLGEEPQDVRAYAWTR